jgi:hypothetical protein
MHIKTLIGAGNQIEYYEPANFFRILGADHAALKIDFFRAGAIVATVENVGAGYAESFIVPIDRVIIKSGVEQDVSIVLRLGSEVRYDTPPTGAVEVQNLPENQLVTVSNHDSKYDTYQNSFSSNQAMVLGNVQVVVSPTLNVNGIVVHRATMISIRSAGNFEGGGLLAKNGVPNGIVDGDVLLHYESASLNERGYWLSGKLERPIFIPAGKGLFFIVSNSESYGQRSVLYTVM